MEIENIAEVKNWLSQFEEALPDQFLASYMLKKLRYVGFEEVEEWIQTSLVSLIEEISDSDGPKPPIAIFPVSKPFIHKFNKDKKPKPISDSSGRIAHSLKNLERRLPNHVELNPREESMKARRVRHIIFVDDFVGTGNRFIKSWRTTVSRSVKSWCSHGWCKIWLVAFAAHKCGVNNIVNQVRPIVKERVKAQLTISESFIWENHELASLTYRYGLRINKPRAKLGYGKILSPVIFQHGCPNNVAGIFWCGNKKGKRRWQPLFPERSVPDSLYPLFGFDFTPETTPEELWMVGHYDLATQIINEFDSYHGGHRLIMILGYLDKRKEPSKIQSVLVLSDAEFGDLVSELQNYGLIDSGNAVTKFGKEVLKRGRTGKRQVKEKIKEYSNFYPASFMGIQRDI